MRSVQATRRIVTGTTAARVGTIPLPAGSWDIAPWVGCPSAVATASLYVRARGSATNLLTFTSAVAPARLAAQRLVLASATEVEFWLANSSVTAGVAMVDDIQVRAASLRLYANNISTRLGGPLAVDATAIELTAGGGTGMPSPSNGEFFLLTIQRGDVLEIVRVTARSGDALTVTRAQEGTDAVAWPVSSTTVRLTLTAGALSEVGDAL